MRMLNDRKNSKGISLVAVLIAVVIFGIALVTMVQLLTTQMRTQKKIVDKAVFNDLMNNVRIILDNSNVCTCNFQGKTFDVSALDQPIVLNEIALYDTKTCTRRGAIVESDEMSIQLKDISFVGTDLYAANLNIKAANFKESGLNLDFSRLIRLSTTTVGTTIQIDSCTATGGFGSFEQKFRDQEYVAPTDGFAVVHVYAGNQGGAHINVDGIVDGQSLVWTSAQHWHHEAAGGPFGDKTASRYGSFTLPVPKGSTWQVRTLHIDSRPDLSGTRGRIWWIGVN